MKKPGTFDLRSSADLRQKIDPILWKSSRSFRRRKSTPLGQNYLNKARSRKRYGQSIMASSSLSPGVSQTVVHAFLAMIDLPRNPLTPRERQVLQLIAEGRTTMWLRNEIAGDNVAGTGTTNLSWNLQ